MPDYGVTRAALRTFIGGGGGLTPQLRPFAPIAGGRISQVPPNGEPLPAPRPTRLRLDPATRSKTAFDPFADIATARLRRERRTQGHAARGVLSAAKRYLPGGRCVRGRGCAEAVGTENYAYAMAL